VRPFHSLVLPFGAWLAAHPALAVPAFRPVLEGGATSAGGDLSVSVTARAERSELGSGFSGFVALAVPFDRLAAPRKLGTAAADREPSATEAEAVPEPPAERANDERDPAPALPAPLLARLARDAVAAALRAHDVPLRRSELEGLKTRARWSATLPELRLRVLRSNDESLRLTPTLEDPERYTHDGGTDFLLEASATWKLNRLVFADEEIAVERLAVERDKNAERLSREVVARLFEWHRALSELGARDLSPKRRSLAELERLEAEVELDVLTGGYFAEVARRFPPPAAPVRPAPSDASRPPSAPGATPPSPP
jgi:hypothetical protein